MFNSLSDWRQYLDQPIVSTLLLSLSLHLVLLALVQPAPGGGGSGPLVINARLEMTEEEAAPVVAKPVIEPVTEPPAQLAAPPVVVPPVVTPPPLLTSSVASPEPPLPVAPAPNEVAPTVVATPVASPGEAKPSSAPAATGGGTPRNGTSSPLSIGIDSTWYVARQVDTHARAQDNIVPDYPEEARRRNQEGSLKLMVKIDDLGRVRDVEVVEADFPGVFDEAAVDAFRKARFHPAMRDGRPVRYQAYIRVVFKLRD